MKKISILIITMCCIMGMRAQNNGTTAQPPQGAILVPGTADLYVTPYDEVSKMQRNAAVSACGCKGDGWRLPTLGELQIIYSHRYEMDFGEGWYWTGEKVRGEFRFYDLNFKNGKVREAPYDKMDFVRCVWSRTPAPAPAGNLQPMPQQSNPPVQPAGDSFSPKNPPVSVAPSSQSSQIQLNSAQKHSRTQHSEGDGGNPYIHGVGIVGGSLNGISYKVFPANKFAVSVDLGVRLAAVIGAQQYEVYNPYWGWYFKNGSLETAPFTLELNVNFMRQGHFVKGLYGMIGGGSSYGWHFMNNYAWYSGNSDDWWAQNTENNGKAGWNLYLGLEYVFNAPISLQVDFRPGLGILFNSDYTAEYFDWATSLSLKYVFK